MSKKTFNIILTTVIILIVLMITLLIAFFYTQESEILPEDKTLSVEQNNDNNTDDIDGNKSKNGEILDYLKPFYEMNKDLVGFIKLDGTRVQYPVVYIKGDVNDFYYLRRNFYKQADIYGVPFVDGHVDLDSNNILIHGHETDNGTQFHDFGKYRDKEFYEKNKTFTYDTLYEKGTYEIVAVFNDRVYYPSEHVFKYYNFFGSNNEKEFDDYVKNIKAKALYDTGVTPKFGDKLLTLSMCSYHTEDGRFVVVARKVNNDKQDKK